MIGLSAIAKWISVAKVARLENERERRTVQYLGRSCPVFAGFRARRVVSDHFLKFNQKKEFQCEP